MARGGGQELFLHWAMRVSTRSDILEDRDLGGGEGCGGGEEGTRSKREMMVAMCGFREMRRSVIGVFMRG